MPKKKQTTEINENTDIYREVALKDIIPSGFEPQVRRRSHFTDDEIEELRISIEQNGLIEPIVLRPLANGNKEKLEIVAGERRFLAVEKIGSKTIGAIVRELTDSQALEIQLEENLQRKQPEPLDEAYSYQYLMEKAGYSVKDLSLKFGRPEKNIAQKLKLNDLSEDGKQLLSDNKLPLGHAIEIAKYPIEAQKEIIKKKYAYKYEDENYGLIPFEKFKEKIRDKIAMALKNASFDTEDENLHPKGLICSKCTARTGAAPLLFGDDFKKQDTCLNRECFQMKTINNIRTKQKQIASRFPKTDDKSTEDLINSVPLVSDSWLGYSDKKDFEGGNFLERQTFIEKSECDFAREAVAIDGKLKGQTVLICTDKNCPVHYTDEDRQGNQPTPWQLERKEKEFQQKVTRLTRAKIFIRAIDYFNKKNLFWNNSELVEKLLQRLIEHYTYKIGNYGGVTEIFEAFAPNAKEWSNEEKNISKFVAGLDSVKISQLLFLLIFIEEDYSTYQMVPQDNVKRIAGKYTDLYYDNLFALTFCDLAPEEFKPLAEDYLAKVQAGEQPEVPRFWFTREIEAAESEEDDLELEEDEEDYDDDIDENDLGETTQG